MATEQEALYQQELARQQNASHAFRPAGAATQTAIKNVGAGAARAIGGRFRGVPMPAQRQGKENDGAINKQRAMLQLGKTLATGGRDRSKSKTAQAAGELAARGGQALGTYFGGIGAPIGKRIGRVAGEHWKITLIVVALGLVFLPLTLVVVLSPVLLPLVPALAAAQKAGEYYNWIVSWW